MTGAVKSGARVWRAGLGMVCDDLFQHGAEAVIAQAVAAVDLNRDTVAVGG